MGSGQPVDLVWALATFAAFTVVEHAIRSLAVLRIEDLGRFSLIGAALADRWWIAGPLAVAAAAALVLCRPRLLTAWPTLEQGRALRWLAGTAIVILAWQSSIYDYNWMAGRLHLLDRLLVVALAAGALARPVLLVPFALVVRIVNEQFVFPFATTAGRNIDDFLVLVVLAVAAGHLVYVVTGRNRTSPVLLVVATALASHFFVPGKGKVSIGWLSSGDLSNLPLSSYTAGWLGHTAGGWAEGAARVYERVRIPVMAATLALELGSIVAVIRPRLTRWWLPACMVFHLVTFATTGFWFLPWIAVEIALLVALSRPSLRSWVDENATPGRSLIAVLAVLGAPVLFHPPGLAWLDAPLSYGYQLEGSGIGGAPYHVPAAALAPLSHHVAFDRLQLGPTVPASGAYGAVTTPAEITALDTITDFDQLKAYEAGFGPPTLTAESQRFLSTYLEFTHQPHTGPWARASRWLGPPEHFWTSRSDPSFRFQEPLDELQVYLVRDIHHDGHPERDRELVLTLRIDADGRAVVADPAN